MRTYLIALILFLSGTGYLAYAGFVDGRTPHVGVGELLAAPRGHIDKAKLFGTVSGQGLTRMPDGLGARFQLVDNTNAGLALWVEYKGALPDLFEPGAEVILEGHLLEPQQFNATSLSTKCPSKYEKANRENRT